jgi:hypothetical protein
MLGSSLRSGAPTPWQALGKGPGVAQCQRHWRHHCSWRIALGTVYPSATIGSGTSPPPWLKFKPDLRLLNGSEFPPVVPNVIDIRTLTFTQEIIESPHN